jgi:hypothetical protein
MNINIIDDEKVTLIMTQLFLRIFWAMIALLPQQNHFDAMTGRSTTELRTPKQRVILRCSLPILPLRCGS